MLWPREEFHAAYGQMKHDALQSGGTSVLVLVALDVDALCASAILTNLFKADFVSYTLLPVRGYEDIVRIRDVRITKPGSELRSVVMINCGAIVNVTQLLQLPPHVKCYIFDSHRPIHLANIYDPNQQIVVFDDGAQSIEEFPDDGSDIERDEFEESDEEGAEDDDDEDEEDDEEEEAEEVDEDEGEAEVEFGEPAKDAQDESEHVGEEEMLPPQSPSGSTDEDGETKKRKRVEDASGEGDGDDDHPIGGDEDEDEAMSTPKKQKPDVTDVTVEDVDPAPEQNEKMLKRKRREEILRYYRGSFHGAPAASIVYELAQQMNAGANRDLLWFAIVGLTKQFIMEEIDSDNYNLMVHRFQDEVLSLDASAAGGGMEDDQTVSNPAYEHGRISFEEEYRFMCYRHWSLYEAMYYSDYIAAKLGLYMDQARRFGARNAASAGGGDDGETTLHVFLARMGFSLRQSQQKFTYMPLEMKQQLRDKIQEMAPEFGLEDVFYGSFKRQFAFQYLLGAADAVHGLQALLEAPESYISSVFQSENHHQKGGLQQPLTSMFNIDLRGITQAGKEDVAGSDQEEDLRDFKHQNFFLATTALSCRSVASSTLMESGIKVAMELKQAIVRVGISIMERKLIVRVKHFRYVCLNIPEREQELFANPNVLTQLALFLLTVHRASGKWGALPPSKKKKGADAEDDDEKTDTVQQKPIIPLVLITKNPAQNCFLVVGITCPNNPGEVHRNTLGTAFRLAAGETGANFRQDGFSSAVLEIQMDDIQYFVEQLHNVMDA